MALAALLVIVYFYPHPEANRFIYQEGRPWNYSNMGEILVQGGVGNRRVEIQIHLARRSEACGAGLREYVLFQLSAIFAHMPAAYKACNRQ